MSKLQHYESVFVASVDHALGDLWVECHAHLPRFDVITNDFKIELASVGDDNLSTLTFSNLDGDIIAYLDYEEGVGVTGYDLGGVEEHMYYELAGLLLVAQAEGLSRIKETV